MIHKDVIIGKIVEFINSKLSVIYSNNPLMLFIKPLFDRAINNNIGKLDSILKLIQDDKGMIDIENILTEMINNLLVANKKEYPDILGGISIGDGKFVLNIPGINKGIAFTSEDIEDLKQLIINK